MKVYTGSSPPRLTTGQAIQSTQIDRDGAQFVKASVRYVVQYTPAAGDIANGPCDAILTSNSNAVVTLQPADNSGTVALPLAPQVWHPIQCIKVTATTDSSGVVFLGWFRKPT